MTRLLLFTAVWLATVGGSMYYLNGVDADANLEFQVNSRVRYPNEEAIATKACGSRRLMSWWISDPRKQRALMHVHCSGVVTVEVEVKF